MKVVTCSLIQPERRWVYPQRRFVEFGPEDESYCRAAGYGRETIVYPAYQIGGVLYIHPAVAEELKRVDRERNDGAESPLP